MPEAAVAPSAGPSAAARARLEYGLKSRRTTAAIQRGLAEADWYQCEIPRDLFRQLLKRRDGPALRDTAILVRAPHRLGRRHRLPLALALRVPALPRLCRPLRLDLRLALA